MRHAVLLCCLFAASAVVAKDPAPQAVQFIDRTNILFPKVVGGYTVDTHTQDPDVFGGVSVGYLEPEGAPPSLTLSAFVYPLGRVEVDAGLSTGLDHVRGGVSGQESYREVDISPDSAFDVPAPTAPRLAGGPRGKEKLISASDDPPQTDVTDDDMAAALATWTQAATTPGRRIVMHFTTRGTAVRSVGYVFYRQMMLVKLRMTVAADEVDEAGFLALADQAAAAIAPSFEIQNFGRCAVHYLPKVPDKGSRDDKSGGLAMIQEVGRVKRENCVAREGEPDALPEGMLRHTLVYPPDTWK
jgi:hypothetical protein